MLAALAWVMPARPAGADGRDDAGTSTGPHYPFGWQEAPVVLDSAVRANMAIGFHDQHADASDYDNTTVSVLSAHVAFSAQLSGFARAAVASDTSPVRGSSTRVGNPTIGARYRRWLAPFWLADLSLGVTAPAGGGAALDDASADELSAWAARPGASEMFFGDYLAVSPSVGITSTHYGGTVRAELGLQHFARVRGAGEGGGFETSAHASVFVGSFFLPFLSLGAEASYQRWLSTPPFLARDDSDSLRATLSLALGLRVHIPLTHRVWLLPGLSYFSANTPGHEQPLGHGILIDVPVAF